MDPNKYTHVIREEPPTILKNENPGMFLQLSILLRICFKLALGILFNGL